MSDPNAYTFLPVAISAAYAAGALIETCYKKDTGSADIRHHDIKLEIDREAEDIILDYLEDSHPQHGYLTEESGEIPGTSEYVWVIDPLDGTVNYYYGIFHFCVSIACYRYRKSKHGNQTILDPVLGVVYQPISRTLYHGVSGNGSFENGKRLQLNGKDDLSKTIACVSLTSRYRGGPVTARIVEALVEKAMKVRSLGATALDSALIASGSVGAFVQRGTNLWDFGAAKIIVEEAGGFYNVSTLENSKYKILAGCPGVKSDLQQVVEDATGEEWEAHDLSL